MNMISSMIVILSLLAVFYLVMSLVRLFRKKATASYIGEDGRFRRFGNVMYDISSDRFHLKDTNQPVPNRYQGYSNVENGLALINLRDDPSQSSLSEQVSLAGYVDLTGNIYGKSHNLLGYITDAKGRPSISGSGKWYELWLRKHSYVYLKAGAEAVLESEGGSDGQVAQDVCVAKVVETGRLFKAKPNVYTVTSRAGAFALLYKNRQAPPPDEEHALPSATWKDTALMASFIYAFIYAIFYLTNTTPFTLPALGEQIGFLVVMLLVYFLIWALVRQFKIEKALTGDGIDDFLMLFNRNTGVGGLTNLIIIFTVCSLLVSVFLYGSDFIPLQLAVLIGVMVNRRFITSAPWEVVTHFEEEPEDWDSEDEGEEDADGDGEVPPVDPEMSRTVQYEWTLDSSYNSLKGEFELTFDLEKLSALRANNPFRTSPGNMFRDNIAELFRRNEDKSRMHKLLRYINRECREAGLSQLEKMQFILDFVQAPNISYEYDNKCDEIGNMREYARFPDETMFDKRGDCDCKAALAAALFAEAGFKTAYITTMTHAAVAVAFKEQSSADLLRICGDEIISKDGYLYFFCETTGDNFRIGDLTISSKNEIQDILYLN